MTRYLQFTFGLFFLLLTGCISQELQNAASKAASTIKAGKTKVAKGVAVATDKENYKSLNLEFSDFEGVPDDYDNEKLSSIAALTFYRNLQPKDYADFEKIQVTLSRQNTTYEALYDIKKLETFESQVNVVNAFIDAIKLKSFETYETFIDTVTYDKDVQLGIYNQFMKVDSLSGEIIKARFTGFAFTATKKKKIPQTTIWFQLEHANDLTELKFVVDSPTNKIMLVVINAH